MSAPERLDTHSTTLEGSVSSAEQLFKRFKNYFNNPDDSEMSKNPLPADTTVTDVLFALHRNLCSNINMSDKVLVKRAIQAVQDLLAESRIKMDIKTRRYLEIDLEFLKSRQGALNALQS